MTELNERGRIGLLLRRAGFGAGPDELERYARLGLAGTLDELLHHERVEEDFNTLLESLEGHLLDLQNIEDVQTWWLYRMGLTRRPLLEKMALFWHGHFAVSNAKVQNPLAMHRHVELLREHALDSYREMLMGVSRDPAMLLWLDGATNRKAAPNENYGRELLELYTLGIGQYSEADVQAAARAFSGWNLRNGEFFFDRVQHELSPQTFLGRTGPLDGGDVIDLLVGHAATAERLTRKLFAFFAYPEPEPEVLDPLVKIYLERGYQILPVLEAIFKSEAFYSDRSRYEHLKSPVELVVGSVRMLGGRARERGLIVALRGMGQEVLLPPNVAGWAGGPAWINPSTMLTRFNFAARLATARDEPNDGGLALAAELLGVDGETIDAEGVVERLLEVLGGLELSPDSRRALVEYLASPLTYPPYLKVAPNPQQKQQAIDARLRGPPHGTEVVKMQRRTRRNILKIGGAGALAACLAACSTAPALPAPASEEAPLPPSEGAIASPPVVPASLTDAVAPASARVTPDRRILIVVQLSGGNDGLNAIVPYGDGMYYQLRPQLAVPAEQVVPLDGKVGLHPNIGSLKSLYHRGTLALIQGVGYPNPSRSHFRSMEIWHTARPDGATRAGTSQLGTGEGWLGAFMAEVYRVGESPFQCVNIGNNIPRALWSERAPTATLQDGEQFQFLADRKLPIARDPLLKTFGQMYGEPSRKLPSLQLVSESWGATARGVDALSGTAERYRPAAQYPAHPFGKTLQQVARMVAAAVGTRVYYVSLGGFDTHANQKPSHANLMTLVADGLAALQQELEQMGRADGALILGFSEFGRRVRENGSGGTDHGAAGPMFAIGRGVKGGIYGDHPNLANLDDGDLRYTVDFRQVYATVPEDWLGAPSRRLRGGSFERLGFVA